MGQNTLADVDTGNIIIKQFWNDYKTAMGEDFVGRNTAGAPTSNKRLGTPAIPWGNTFIGALFVAGQQVDFTALVGEKHSTISSRTRTTSNQPQFIDPAGVGNGLSATLQASATDLSMVIGGSAVIITSDLAISPLNAAPGANNTALVDMIKAADQVDTRTWGEQFASEESIIIDAAGSEITSKVGQFAAFSLNNGVDTEIFYGFIQSATEIRDIRRGFFYDENAAPVNRILFSNNDTITLLLAGFVFVDVDGSTIDVSFRAPVFSATEPSSPLSGDYWFDFTVETWKRHDGVSFVVVTRHLVGVVITDDTDCLFARCFDFSKKFDVYNEVDVQRKDADTIQSNHAFQSLSVYGRTINFATHSTEFNFTDHLATSADLYTASEQADTIYYLYISDDAEELISDIEPYFRPDLRGYYHPHNPWRCVGTFLNDSSSDIDTNTVTSEVYKSKIDDRSYSPILKAQAFS